MFACSEETLSKELINLTLNMLEGGRASHVLTSCVLQGYRAKRLAVPHRGEGRRTRCVRLGLSTVSRTPCPSHS